MGEVLAGERLDVTLDGAPKQKENRTLRQAQCTFFVNAGKLEYHPSMGLPTKTKTPGFSGDFAVNAGRLELPTNGLKGHCSAIELRVRTAELILSPCGGSVNSKCRFV